MSDEYLFRHNKTGNLYRWLGAATDCTNSRDGTCVVIYSPVSGPKAGHWFVRECKEFCEKFTEHHVG